MCCPTYYAFEAGFEPASYLPPGITLSDTNWIVGPIADLSIESQQVDPFPLSGNQIGFVKITVGNKGPWDVKHADFGYCQDSALAPFTLNSDVPGGCGAAQSGPACFATGAPSVQFGVGSLAAQQTKSCVLRVTANAPVTASIGFPLFLVGEAQSSSGEYPVDPNLGDNMTELVLAPSFASPVPIGDAAWVIPLGLLAISGLTSASRKGFSVSVQSIRCLPD